MLKALGIGRHLPALFFSTIILPIQQVILPDALVIIPLSAGLIKIRDDLYDKIRDIDIRPHQSIQFIDSSETDFTFEPLNLEHSVNEQFSCTLELSKKAIGTEAKISQLKNCTAARYFNAENSKSNLGCILNDMTPSIDI